MSQALEGLQTLISKYSSVHLSRGQGVCTIVMECTALHQLHLLH